jgi:SAM-dependent methyltransferase
MVFFLNNFIRRIKSHKQLEFTDTNFSKNSLRSSIACRYLTGTGIEIGALHSPLEVPSDVTVRYLDRMPINQLRQQYSDLAEYELVEIDIVDDGETLASVLDVSVDFVIANHMIEHCQNPIFSIENWLRVLKPSGILYMAVPDKRYTFDCKRPRTTLEHLIRDYTEGPRWSMNSHFEEWARLVDKVPEHEVATRAKFVADVNYSIHFHVWTQVEFLELLLYCRSNLSFPIEIELIQKNGVELIVVLSKTI